MRCSQCVPTPSFGSVFETTIDGVCSGRCEPCLPCYERAKFTDGRPHCRGLAPDCPLGPSFWDEVVGVPLEDWMAAGTADELAALLARRDA